MFLSLRSVESFDVECGVKMTKLYLDQVLGKPTPYNGTAPWYMSDRKRTSDSILLLTIICTHRAFHGFISIS